jgi:hypothetical protein
LPSGRVSTIGEQVILGCHASSKVVPLVHERYADFGPKLAHEKLVEVHGIRVGRETLRGWLTAAKVHLVRRLAAKAECGTTVLCCST